LNFTYGQMLRDILEKGPRMALEWAIGHERQVERSRWQVAVVSLRCDFAPSCGTLL